MEKGSLLTVREAAGYLRVHPITLYRLLQKQRIPGAFKIGNQWRLKKEAIESNRGKVNSEIK